MNLLLLHILLACCDITHTTISGQLRDSPTHQKNFKIPLNKNEKFTFQLYKSNNKVGLLLDDIEAICNSCTMKSVPTQIGQSLAHFCTLVVEESKKKSITLEYIFSVFDEERGDIIVLDGYKTRTVHLIIRDIRGNLDIFHIYL